MTGTIAMPAPKGRSAGRRQVVFKGEIRLIDRQFSCIVRDISATGARLSSRQMLSKGTALHLFLPKFGTFPSVVAWADRGLMGVVFVDGEAAGLQRLGDKARMLGLLDAAPDGG
jgi:PilZ domain